MTRPRERAGGGARPGGRGPCGTLSGMRSIAVAVTKARTIVAGLSLALALGCGNAEPPPATSGAAAAGPADASDRSDPSVVEALAKAKRDTACLDAAMLASAVDQYLLVKAACPVSAAELLQAGIIARIPTSAPSWSIACTGDGPVVRAPGADGRLGTDDDLVHGGPRATCER